MPKPPTLEDPRKITVYLPNTSIEHGRAIARRCGISFSRLLDTLINSQSAEHTKVRVTADFPADEFTEIEREAERAGQSVEDFIRSATYSLLDRVK